MYTDDNGIVRFEALDNVAPLQVNLNAALESVSDSLTDTNERIDVLEEDTGWLPIVMNYSGFEVYGTSQIPMVRRVGKVVQVQGAARNLVSGQIDGTTQVPFGKLPTGYNLEPPSHNNYMPNAIMQGSGNNKWNFSVHYSGELLAARYSPGSSTSNTWLPFTLTWLVD